MWDSPTLARPQWPLRKWKLSLNHFRHTKLQSLNSKSTNFFRWRFIDARLQQAAGITEEFQVHLRSMYAVWLSRCEACAFQEPLTLQWLQALGPVGEREAATQVELYESLQLPEEVTRLQRKAEPATYVCCLCIFDRSFGLGPLERANVRFIKVFHQGYRNHSEVVWESFKFRFFIY